MIGMHFLSYFLYLPIIAANFGAIAAFSSFATFMANDRCTLLLSGSLPNAQSVRSVQLNCHQGALLWENPGGSLLATFSPPPQFHGGKCRICLRFPDPMPEGTILNSIFQSQFAPFPSPSAHSLHCFSLNSASDRLQLFVRIPQNLANEIRQTLSLYYAMEEVDGGNSADPQCGLCPQSKFLDHFCSANFVFIGKLLHRHPEGNFLEFSAESPLIRRPLLLTHISRQNDQFNSTTLFADCPSNVLPQFRPSLHTKFVIVANAHLGFARLLCLLEFPKFQSIPKDTAPCDIELRR